MARTAAAFENATFATKRGLYRACRSSSGFWRTESGVVLSDAEMIAGGWDPVLTTIPPTDQPDSPTWDQIAPALSERGVDFAEGFNAALELLGVEVSEPAAHTMKVTDETVKGHEGTVARCSCGWVCGYAVRDGSAEASAEDHRIANDEDYRQKRLAEVAEYQAAERARGCTCPQIEGTYSRGFDLKCPLHGFGERDHDPKPASKIPKYCHSCSCHIDPPCDECVNCAHVDHPECPNDCQTCEDHDDEY